MQTLNNLFRQEISFPHFLGNTVETAYGKLFYNVNNPSSYDTNHAVITNLDSDLDSAITEITAFYREKELVPRIYHSCRRGDLETLQPFFNKYGYTYEVYDNSYMLWQKPSAIKTDSLLEIKRVKELDEGILAIIHTEGEAPWVEKAIRHQLPFDHFHQLVGYRDGVAVTMASLMLHDGVSRIDDVMTRTDERGKGYCRMLMHELVGYHSALTDNRLFLYTANPTAMRIYEEAGFVELDTDFKTWMAWKE